MFACIYCDNNTLVVIGKQSKRLKLMGETKVKETGELKWPGTDKVFKSRIVKISGKFPDTNFSSFLHSIL